MSQQIIKAMLNKRISFGFHFPPVDSVLGDKCQAILLNTIRTISFSMSVSQNDFFCQVRCERQVFLTNIKTIFLYSEYFLMIVND